jgi:hypothetical protein
MSPSRHLSIFIFRPGWPSLHPFPLSQQLPGTKKQTSRQTNAKQAKRANKPTHTTTPAWQTTEQMNKINNNETNK